MSSDHNNDPILWYMQGIQPNYFIIFLYIIYLLYIYSDKNQDFWNEKKKNTPYVNYKKLQGDLMKFDLKYENKYI
jgi:hypothetical protein